MKHIPRLIFLVLAIIAFSATSVNMAMSETQKTILAFGDSLIAGYGISSEYSFPAQLEKRLRAAGHEVKVINAGVSGDTTSGGLTRLEWTLEQKPDFVILELGANDMLRGIDPRITRENLQKMLDILKARNIPVLLTGMRSLPNMGSLFGDSYQKMYKELSKKYGTAYYPFFLEGVALEPGYVLEDGLHPNARGIAVVVDNILPTVEKLLKEDR